MAILSNTEFGILRLTISRAQKRNSINAEMFDTMTEALSRAASDDAVRVVLLQGGEQILDDVAPLAILDFFQEVLAHEFGADVEGIHTLHGVGVEVFGLAVAAAVARGA